jgi:hypothetical protein
MDRIIIQINSNGEKVDRIFLQRDGVPSPKDNILLDLADQSPTVKAAYTTLVNQLSALAPALPKEATFVVVETISTYPLDETITRTVSANIPSLTSNPIKTYEMPVVVKHYRNGVYINNELNDIIEIFTASNEKLIDDGIGRMVGEADYFESLGDKIFIKDLMRGQIQAEDAKGRFNRQYSVA